MNTSAASPCGNPSARATAVGLLKRFSLIGGVLLAAALLVSAQSVQSELQEKLAAVKQAAAENKQKLQQYRWVETTQPILKGNVKPSTQNSCQYGPGGTVQKTLMSPPPPPPSGRRLKERIIEDKTEEMQQYMGQVKILLGMYLPPDPGRMDQAFKAGKVSLNPTAAGTNVIFADYAVPGDRMVLTFDPAAKKITSLNVDSYMGDAKDTVTLKVEMATLLDGASYERHSVLSVAAKQLVVTTTNSDYQSLSGH